MRWSASSRRRWTSNASGASWPGLAWFLDDDLLDPAALAALRDNGTMDTLAEKFFSDAFTITYEDLDS